MLHSSHARGHRRTVHHTLGGRVRGAAWHAFVYVCVCVYVCVSVFLLVKGPRWHRANFERLCGDELGASANTTYKGGNVSVDRSNRCFYRILPVMHLMIKNPVVTA